jgi:hypothetical protein
MSTRDKSDFGSGKILPDELPDPARSHADDDEGVVHPERDWATGPDIAAAEAADHAAHASSGGSDTSSVERGAHFRADGSDDVPHEPLDPPHPPKHVRSADSA